MSNEMALQNYQERQEKKEVSLNLFFDKIDDRLEELSKKIQSILKVASEYDGYDFREEVVEYIKGEIRWKNTHKKSLMILKS